MDEKFKTVVTMQGEFENGDGSKIIETFWHFWTSKMIPLRQSKSRFFQLSLLQVSIQNLVGENWQHL